MINRTNVGKLHVLCSASFGAIPDFQSGPLAVGGVLYATSRASTYAVDGVNCRRLWTATEPLPAGGGTNRGAAYAGGLLFRGFANGHVVALSASTGRTKWDVNVLPAGSHAYLNAAPIVQEGLVFIGTAGGDIAETGHMMALEAATNATRWSVQTVPAVGSVAAQTSWKGAAHIAGGSTWTSYTLDTGTVPNLLYVSTGNPGPDFYGADRGGVNLGSESVAVFDATTGAEQTEYQLIPHDVHDHGVGARPASILRLGARLPLLRLRS